jgi:hypothetical protein
MKFEGISSGPMTFKIGFRPMMFEAISGRRRHFGRRSGPEANGSKMNWAQLDMAMLVKQNQIMRGYSSKEFKRGR